MIKIIPFSVGYDLPDIGMTVFWSHNVFKQGKQKCDKTQYLIDNLTNLLCEIEVGIMVLDLAYITLMRARPQ